MAKPPEAKTKVNAVQTKAHLNKPPESMPVIYADRIVNVGFGPGVSRLTLAMETGASTFTPTATLVMPTTSLLDAMSVVFNTLQGNDEVREGLFKGLDALRAQIIALKQ